jgi:molecular chaperone DnaK
VTFDIDANGILNVSAKDKGTGKEQRITITASSGLAQDEIDRMVAEAEEHAEEDRRKREEIEVLNTGDNLAHAAEKMLSDNADKVPEELKAEIEGKVASLREAVAARDAAKVKTQSEELQAALQRVGEAVYSQDAAGEAGAPEGGQPGDPASGESPEDTVEGEFREV